MMGAVAGSASVHSPPGGHVGPPLLPIKLIWLVNGHVLIMMYRLHSFQPPLPAARQLVILLCRNPI